MFSRWIVYPALAFAFCAVNLMGQVLPGQSSGKQAAAAEAGSALNARNAAVKPGTAPLKRRTFATPEEAIASAMDTVLKGYRFNKRLVAPNQDDNWLLFSRGSGDVALVGWTTSNATDRVALAPASPMTFIAYAGDGTALGTIQTVDYEIGMVLEKEPKILIPERPNGYLAFAASAQTVEPVMRVKGPQTLELTCEFHNPTPEVAIMPVPDMGKTIAVQPGGSQTIRKSIEVGRSAEPIRTTIGAMGINQQVTIVVENPLELYVRPEEPRLLTLDIVNNGGEEVAGEVIISIGTGAEPFRFPLEIKRGQRVSTMRIPLGVNLPLPAPMQVAVEQTVGQPMRKTYVLAQTGALQFVPTANFSNTGKDGEPSDYRLEEKGVASAAVRGGTPREPIPWPEQGALSVVYDLGSSAPRHDRKDDAGIDIVPVTPAAQLVYGNPTEISFWLMGDGTGNLLSMVWKDAAGRELTAEPMPLSWKGWRYVTFRVPTEGVRYPLSWVSLLRLAPAEGGSLQSRHGSLLANGFCFTYGINRSLSAYREVRPAYEESVSAPAVPVEVEEDEVLRGNPMRFKGNKPRVEAIPVSPRN